MLLTAALGIVGTGPGCGGGSAAEGPGEPPASNIGLREVGEMYRAHLKQKARAPGRLKDFDMYAPGFPQGSLMLQNGELVTFWGAQMAAEDAVSARAVLAYEAKVPREGGLVLLDDGETLRPMTAAEFQAAPKAGTVDSTAEVKKTRRSGR